MAIRTRNKTLGATAALMLAGGLVLGGAPAQASNRPIDITGYTVADVVVANNKCKSVLVTAKAKHQKDFAFGGVDAFITRKGDDVTSAGFDFENKKKTSANDRVEICPDDYGLGVYSVGPAYVFAFFEYKQDGTLYEDARDYWDNTKKSFNVRGQTKSSLSAKRSGKKVTLSVKASVYSPEKDRYIQYNPKNAKFQVKSGKTWKTVKTLKLAKGQASVTVSDAKKKTYRVTVPTASWAVATTSKAISK